MVVSGEYDISGLIHRVQAIVKQTAAQAVVLDSATALFSPRPPQELLRSLFFQLIHAFRSMRAHRPWCWPRPPRTTASSRPWASRTSSATWWSSCATSSTASAAAAAWRSTSTARSAHYKGEFPSTITARGLTIFPLTRGSGRARTRASATPAGPPASTP